MRDPVMHIRVATTPHPTAAQAAPGVSRQVSAVEIDTMSVAMPGIQVAPTRVMATISLVTDSGKADSLSGSMVGSIPVAISGMRNQPSVTATPPITTVACWTGCG